MEPNVSIKSGCMIRVAVLPVGEMPAAHLRDYVAMVLQHSRIDLSSVSSFYTEHQKSPFTQQPWEKGSLRFKFMVGGAARSPWEDFQAQRKVLGVIGLCHCPLSHDLGAAYDQFVAICNAYPSAQTKRCFAFHPSDAQVEQDDKKRQHLVLFPPADQQTLEFHMHTLMQDFAASLLMQFESWVLLAEPVGATLTTPLDSQATLNAEEVSKAKKRRLCRVQKTIGDYCLLAGSPVDANAHYTTAIELARLTGDVFWQAGAIEGSICALVVDRTGQKDQALEEEVKFQYFEVIQLYRRATALIFELEAALKLARFLCRKELAREVSDLLTGAVESSKNLTDASDRLVLFVEVARIFEAVGYQRKAAFFSRQVAQLYQQQGSRWAAMSSLQVLLMTAKSYHIQSRSSFLKSSQQPLTDENRQIFSIDVGCEGQWSTLQMDVLADTLAAAVRAGDPLAAWKAAAQLLRRHYPLITPSSQVSLAYALSSVAARLPTGSRCSEPALPFIRLHLLPPLPLQMEVVKRTLGKKDWWAGPSSSGPFIYTPFTSKGGDSRDNEKVEVTWVVGEPVQVIVEVANPCAFEISVDSISLSVDSGDFEAFPLSIVLPPNTAQVVSLSGVALSAGSLVVRGCFVNLDGIVSEHLFEDIEELIVDSMKGLSLGDPFRSAGGTKIRPSPCPEIVVMPPLPLLVAQVVGGEGAVVLYEGEIREIQISLSNAGVVPVVEANVSLTGKQREHVISVGHNLLQAALPLEPGAAVLIPVKLKAGPPNSELENGLRSVHGSRVKVPKEGNCPMLIIHYAGPSQQDRTVDRTESVQLPPGRRVALPLQLHVLRGLCLAQARLLSMEVPAQISRSLPDPNSCKPSSLESAVSLVRMDPYRGSWSLRLLELELWNATDVLFEITVGIKEKKVNDGNETELEAECLYPTTRIDREYSARVLIPLEKFKLPVLDKALLGKTSPGRESRNKLEERISSTEKQTKKDFNAIIEELSSRICVKWHSGRNSSGELPINDAIREALQASAVDILIPDPLTFGFRLAKLTSVHPADYEDACDHHVQVDGENEPATLKQTNMKNSVLAREVTPIEMLVRNNTREAVTMTLSVTCRDVTGASCLGSVGEKATVLWAGALNGIDVEVSANGEFVHTFALCFLVPGEYTLLGAAIIHHATEALRPQAKILQTDNSLEPLCFSGPPFGVHVAGTS
ncbi:hypothetical protein O6H91_21G038400 [Diphasiastrum complanatum]|uniref:Uncharacterized protein n=2 Tax=Diphasiastrum complanatum TaxID=34168 RepID=A0ACC2AL93_DIPCM|nr:hypothetical protein O6H91_21G038400 [Diphasiastrum complanatum]KAJ7517735.1 hypothetical protein O6H91_21G038400 [Diphasiastrum complanatum]